MKKSRKPNNQLTDEIYLKAMLFDYYDDSTDVVLYAYYNHPEEGCLSPVMYSCPFSIMTTLLNFAGDAGGELFMQISDYLADADAVSPYTLDVEAMYGVPLKIEQIALSYHKPIERNEKGKWVEVDSQNIFIIADLKRKETANGILMPTMNFTNEYVTVLEKLSTQYTTFLQLLYEGSPIPEARKEADFDNDLLFNLAAIHHQMIMHSNIETKA